MSTRIHIHNSISIISLIIKLNQAIHDGRLRQSSRKIKPGPVQRVHEPRLRLGVVEQGPHGGRGIRLGQEEKQAEAAGFRRNGGGDTVVLLEHVVEVVVGGNGDEGVEVLVGELVLQGEAAAVEEGAGEAGGEGGEGGAAVAIDDDHAGVAAYVAEGLVVGPGDDVAAVAAHETELGVGDGRERVDDNV